MTTTDPRLEAALVAITDTVLAQEEYFCELDAVAGDGDFGYSLARGFEVVRSGWETFPRDDSGVLLQRIAATLTSRIGGTSGPIWGTAFLRAGAAARGKATLTADDLLAMLTAAIDGIMARGGAKVGDKTLLDALVPVRDRLAETVASGDTDPAVLLPALAVTARDAAEATSALRASRGRATYVGDRSIGSPDAGAVAVAVLVERVAERLLAD